MNREQDYRREQDYPREEPWGNEGQSRGRREQRYRSGEMARGSRAGYSGSGGPRNIREEPWSGEESQEQFGSPHDQWSHRSAEGRFQGEHQRGYEHPGWQREEQGRGYYGSREYRRNEGPWGNRSAQRGNDFEDRYNPGERGEERMYREPDYGSSHDQPRSWSGRGEREYGYNFEPGYGRGAEFTGSSENHEDEDRRRFQGVSRRGWREESRAYRPSGRGADYGGHNDDREEYREWLQEHRDEPRETEGERQLEGLQEEWRERQYAERRRRPEQQGRGRMQARGPGEFQGSGWRGGERQEYYDWLEEHRDLPPETEGERELEGLQEEWRRGEYYNGPAPGRSRMNAGYQQQGRGGGRYREREAGDRGDYEQWLEDHQGNVPESEGERQLEGLQPQHRSHISDRRYQSNEGRTDQGQRTSSASRQPRSQRRLEPSQSSSRRTSGQSSRAARPTVSRGKGN
jgi:hypothetical protein